MKVIVHKSLQNARYYVSISATEFTKEELGKMNVFGSPFVSIEPKAIEIDNQWQSQIPLYEFAIACDFATQDEAEEYLIEIKERLKNAVVQLRQLQDNFSKQEEHEF